MQFALQSPVKRCQHFRSSFVSQDCALPHTLRFQTLTQVFKIKIKNQYIYAQALKPTYYCDKSRLIHPLNIGLYTYKIYVHVYPQLSKTHVDFLTRCLCLLTLPQVCFTGITLTLLYSLKPSPRLPSFAACPPQCLSETLRDFSKILSPRLLQTSRTSVQSQDLKA